MKKLLSLLLAVLMLFNLCVPAFAIAAADQVLTYSLDVGGEHEVTVNTDDVITVNYVIINGDAENSADTITTQDQIKYDHKFFEFVEGSNLVSDSSGKDFAGNDIATVEEGFIEFYDLTDAFEKSLPVDNKGEINEIRYVFFNSTADCEIYPAEAMLVGTFQLKVLATEGSSVVENTEYKATAAGSVLFGSAKQDLTVIIDDGGGSSKVKETTPSATFTATGDSTGTLSGLAAGMKYSTNGGTSWTDVPSGTTSVNLTGLSAGTIKVVKKGDGETTRDSDEQTITVTKGTKPSAGKTDCTTISNNNGTITGVTNAMEYKKSTDSGWTVIGGTTVTGLANGTYYVRVKANGTALASEQQTVTISEYTPGALGGSVSITGTATYGETLTADVTGITNNSGTLSYQWKRGEVAIEGATGSTYTTVAADIGKEITVTVTSSVETGSKTSSAVTVGKKELTITGVNATNRQYLEDNKIVVLTGGSVSGTINSDAVTVDLTAAVGTMDDANVGTGKSVTVTGVKLGGADAGNYTLSAQPTGVTVDITKATPEYKAPTNLTATYGQTLADVDIAGGNGTGDGVWSWVDDTESVGDASDTAKKFKAKFTPTDDDNYETCSNIDVEVKVGKKELTITGVTATERAYNKSKTVDLVGTSAQLQGVVGEDVVTIDMTSATGVVADANAEKNKTVTVTGVKLGGASKDNYTLTQPTGIKVTINQKALTITGVSAKERPYDGTTEVELIGGSLVGVEDGDTVSFNLGKGSIESADVGNDKSVDTSITLTGADAANYTLTKLTGITVNITKADQKPNITSTKTLYVGGTAFDLNTLVSGTVGAVTFEKTSGDAAELSGSNLTPTTDPTKVGEVKITVNAAGNENYKPYTGTITVTVSDKVDAGVSITNGATNATKTYGDAQFTLNATTTDAGTAGTGEWTWTSNNTDVLTVDDTGKVTVVGVGTAKITAKYESDTTIGTAETVITVNPKKLTITGVTAETRPYDGTKVVALTGGTLAGVVNGDNVTINATSAEGTVADAGAGQDKIVTVNGFALDGDDKGNYTLTQPTGIKVTINPKALTTTGITALDRKYNGETGVTLSDSGAAVSGKIGEDDVSVDISNAAGKMADANVGENKSVTVTGVKLTGNDANNYTLSKQPDYVTVTITKADAKTDVTGTISLSWETTGAQTVDVSLFPAFSGVEGATIVSVTEDNDPDNLIASCLDDTFTLETLDSAAEEKTATLEVVISSDNYEDTTAVLTVVVEYAHDIFYEGDEHVIFAKDLTESAGEGETVSFTFTIRPRYIVDTVTVKTANGDKVKVKSYNGVYSFVMPDEDVTVIVTSERKIISSEIVIKDDSSTTKGETNPETGAPVEAAPFAALAAVIAAGVCFACRKNKETK